MKLPEEIQVVLDERSTNLCHWSKLLDFFQQNQSTLTKKQKIRFYKRSEDYRRFWNTDRKVVERMKSHTGEWREIQRVKPSLNIQITDINPDNVYTDKDIQLYLQTKDQTIPSLIFSYLMRFLPLTWQKSAG